MATIEETIYSHNTTHAGVSGLIGTRCYPRLLPENVELPAMVYQVVSHPSNLYTDQDASPPDRFRWRIQFDLYASTFGTVKDLWEQVFDAWAGHYDADLGWAWVVNTIDDYDTQLNLYRRIVELVMDHSV